MILSKPPHRSMFSIGGSNHHGPQAAQTAPAPGLRVRRQPDALPPSPSPARPLYHNLLCLHLGQRQPGAARSHGALACCGTGHAPGCQATPMARAGTVGRGGDDGAGPPSVTDGTGSLRTQLDEASTLAEALEHARHDLGRQPREGPGHGRGPAPEHVRAAVVGAPGCTAGCRRGPRQAEVALPCLRRLALLSGGEVCEGQQ